MQFKLSPIQECALFLGILAAAAAIVNVNSQGLTVLGLHLLSTLGISLLWFFLLKKSTNQSRNVWDTVITGLILFVVLHYPREELKPALITAALVSILAVSSKFFLHYKGMPILNPAATGLLAVVWLEKVFSNLEAPFISWWGTDFRGYLSLILVLGWIIFKLKTWGKYSTLLAFLAAHMLFLLARGEGTDLINYTFTHSTIFFLASIMLVEPKTSPLIKWQQIAYGVVAALALNLWLHFGLSYGELFAIVIANVFNLGLKVQMMLKTKPA